MSDITGVKSFFINSGKLSLPAFLAIFLIIIGAVNIHIESFSSFVPLFVAMSVFYWGIYVPSLMPKWLVFVLGIFHDAVYGIPAIGLSSALLLIMWGLVVSQQRHLIKEPFFVIWVMFTLSISIYIFLYWLIYCLYIGNFIFPVSVILQLLVSVFLYPLIHKLFNSVHGTLLKDL